MAAADEARVIVRIERHGSGLVRYYTTFDLYENGALTLTRRAPSGAVMERRIAEVESDELERYQDVLGEGNYYSSEPDALRSPFVSRVIGEIQDNPGWRIEVFRDGASLAVAFVPPVNASRRRPELNEIPFVRSAWTLVEEFESKWDPQVESKMAHNSRSSG